MFIAETDSTNTLLRQHFLDREDLFTVYTDFQTAGRGQQGNGWESEKGKNLLFSTLLRQWQIPLDRLFLLNQAVSLALYRAVLPCLPADLQPFLAIKWPNDLYFKDRKLAGILIENLWQANRLHRSIAGIGLNVNQARFLSSAPNPVSLCQITGHEIERLTILHHFLRNLQSLRTLLPDNIHQAYMNALYRRQGLFLWEEREVSTDPTMPQTERNNRQFLASIHTILPSGELVLLTKDNQLRTYHFKQVRYVL